MIAAFLENQPQPVRPPLGRRAKCEIAVLFLFLVAAFTVLLLGAFLFHPPNYNPRFKVDTISMSPLNLSSSESTSIPAKWSIQVSVKNKLEVMQYFEDLEVFLYYSSRNQLLSNATIPDFYQQPREETRVMVESKSMLEHSVAQPIAEDLKRSNGTVGFDLKIKFISDIGALFLFETVCRDVKIGASSTLPQPCSTTLIK